MGIECRGAREKSLRRRIAVAVRFVLITRDSREVVFDWRD
jgi:hypothetical protein